MNDSMLEDLLRAIVKHYGIMRVELALRELQHADDERAPQTQFGRSTQNEKYDRPSYPRKRQKVTAPLYIAKLDLSHESCQPLTELAKKFEDKKFLPTIGEVRNFCILHGIDEPTSSSRVAAIPRVFGFLATMSTNDICAILASDKFSGPSRLAPIADAIRRNAKHEMEEAPPVRPTTEPSSNDPTFTSSAPEKPAVPKKI